MSSVPVPSDLPRHVRRALEEDVGGGDLTAALIPAGTDGWAAVITRESAILCGAPYVDGTFAQLDPKVRIHWKIPEGAAVEANQTLFEIQGPARSLLTGERTALNFLQLLSGTATAAHAFAERLEGHGVPLARHPQDHPRAYARRRNTPSGWAAATTTA